MEPNENPDGLNYITPDTSSPAPTPTASTEPAPIPQVPPVSPVVPVVTPPVSNPAMGNIPEPTPVKKSWFNKKVLYAVWGAILILAGAFSIYNFVFASPDRVLAKMQAKFLEAKSFSYKGEMDFETNKEGSFKLNMVLTGATDFKDADAEKSTSKFLITSGDNVYADAESRIIGKDIFFKINDLAPMILAFIPDRMLEDWYHINSEEVQDKIGLEKTEDKEQLDISEKEVKELYQSLRKNKVLNITETLKSEKIDGENTHHYSYSINKAGLKSFYKESYEILGYEELDTQALDSLDDMPEIKGEIWVGKRTSYLRKVTIKFEENGSKLTFSLSLFDYNKNVEIEKPEGAVDLMDAISGVGGLEDSTVSTCGFDFADGFDGFGSYKNTTDLILEPDSSTRVAVSGDQVSWRSNNRSVAEADSTQGNAVNIKAYKKGKAQLTISAAGASCDLKVYVTVAENQEFSFSGSFGSSNDSKRLADIRQLSTALELYYNDNGGYPAEISDIVPNYIASVPSSPATVGDGCSVSDNEYTYSGSGTSYMGTQSTVYPSYNLKFCLGTETGGYAKGPRTATPQGIQ